MNETIEALFAGFNVGGTDIPVKYLFYMGHGEPYVVYGEVDANNAFSGDDALLGYVDYYDFNIYSKGNYYEIADAIIEKLTSAGAVWQPSRSSGEMFEPDTGYYHKALCFAFLKEAKHGKNWSF